MNTTLPPHIEEILSGDLEDQTYADSSKFINFSLTYKCKSGPVLDPMISSIIDEIEQSERSLPASDNGRYPRKNKRAADPNRRFRNAVRILVLNLLQISEIRPSHVSLGISKDAKYYNLKNSYSPHDMTYDPFIEAYEGLERLGYLEVKHSGYYDHRTGEGMVTKIIPSDELLDLYRQSAGTNQIRYVPRKIRGEDKEELIILKGEDSKGKIKKLPYNDNSFTNNARRNLRKINRVIAKHTIALDCDPNALGSLLDVLKHKRKGDPEQVPYIDFSSIRLYRIFSEGSFERGGRFYRGWWQQVPQKFRPYITIDGQKTVELDYRRYHISIAYALLGLPLQGDPYNIHPKVSEKITKDAINRMLNAKGTIENDPDFSPSHCGMHWATFINYLKDQHRPLVENKIWGCGYGLTLQYQDSLVAEKVLLHFANQAIPCLPIHDSFIVAEQYREELEHTMKRIYKETFGFDIMIENKTN